MMTLMCNGNVTGLTETLSHASDMFTAEFRKVTLTEIKVRQYCFRVVGNCADGVH
jgi:hypothetical protein